jgi:parallel beta-helix repeat protein
MRRGGVTRRRGVTRRWPHGVLLAAALLLAVAGTTRGQVGSGPAGSLPRVDWSRLQPGAVVEIPEGSYADALTISAQGTRERPIVVRAAGGRPVTLTNSVVFSRAAWVRLEGLRITGSRYAGIIIKDGSHDLHLVGNTVTDSALGLWIGDGAGSGHLVSENVIGRNRTHGIAIDRINATPDRPTIFRGNRVFQNGHHGIEIHGSHYIVEGNEVFENGGAVPGTSGIHIFARNAAEDAGDHNVVRYNVSYRNREPKGPDGNGIQVDQWCDDNEVAYNLVFENDGAGVNLFDAGRGRVYNNTMFGNMRDPGRSHPYRGELVLASDTGMTARRVRDATVVNNIAVATRAGVYALYVDAAVAAATVTVRNNLFHHAAGGRPFWWARAEVANVRDLERGGRDLIRDNLQGDPAFVVATPSDRDGFRLGPGSLALGRGLPLGAPRDLLGAPLKAGPLDLGAIQTPR